MRGFLFGSLLLLALLAFGACVDSVPAADGAGSDGGASDDASEGGAGADGGISDGSAEAGRPTPTGAVRWVYTVDVASVNIHLAYDDSGNVFFAVADSGTGTVNGVATGGPTTVVGKINSDGSPGWVQDYDVPTAIYGLDIATDPNGDVWILGASNGTQKWSTGNVSHVSNDYDLYFAHIDGTTGNVKSVYPITTPTATGGLVFGSTNTDQSVHLSRAGNQLVGAFGHNGTVQLPGPAGNISVTGSGQTVTVFRADPLTGITSMHDSFQGTASSYSPGGISVRQDGSMAVVIDVHGAHDNTITNTLGGVTFTQTSNGTVSWMTVVSYTPTNSIAFSAALNNDSVLDDAGVAYGTAYGNSAALDSAGNVIVGGNFNDPIKLANVTQRYLGGVADAFVAKVMPNGSVAWSPILGSPDDENGAAVAVDPWDDVATTLYSGGTINILKTTGGGTHLDESADQFKILSDGGISWNVGINNGVSVQNANDPTPVAVAIDPRNGNIAFGGYFKGSVNLGEGSVSPPHGSAGAAYVIQRAP